MGHKSTKCVNSFTIDPFFNFSTFVNDNRESFGMSKIFKNN